MDIKQNRSNILSDAQAALRPNSEGTDLSSLVSSFAIRTMKQDLEELSKAAKKQPPVVAAPSMPKPAPPPTLPIEPVEAPKPPLVAVAKKASQERQERKAIEKAQKEKEKQIALEKKAAKKAAELKIAQEKQRHQEELKALLKQAQDKSSFSAFDEAINILQKITTDKEAGWFLKWRVNRLIKNFLAKKQIAQKEIKPISKPTPIAPSRPRLATPPTNLPTIQEVVPARPSSPEPLPSPPPPPTKIEIIPPEKPKEQVPLPPTPPPTPIPSLPRPTTAPSLPPTPTPITPSPAVPSTAPAALPRPAQFIFQPKIPAKPAIAEETPIDIKKILLIALPSILVLALIGAGFWVFWQKEPPKASPSPTLTLTPSPTKSPVTTPTALFKTDSQKIIELKTDPEKNLEQALREFIQTDEPTGNFVQILLKNNQGEFLSLKNFIILAKLDIFDLPTQKCQTGQSCSGASTLKEQVLLDNFSLFVYSQAPVNTSPFLAGKNQGRLGLIIPLKNEAASLTTSSSEEQLKQSLKDLEQFLPSGFKFLLPDAQERIPTTPLFLDNLYQNIAVRYLNLPDPNLSFDYAVFDQKIILTTSKESMYAIIDRLLGKNISQ
jgi:hypothetical protein